MLTFAMFYTGWQVLSVHLIQHILKVTASLLVRAVYMKLGYIGL